MGEKASGMASPIERQQVMFQIKINVSKNAILCILKGRFESEGAREYIEKFKEGVDKLKPGFVVITDISTFMPTSDEVRLIFRQGTEYAVGRGMSRAIRIVSEIVASKIGNIQFNRAAKELGYEAEEVTSLEEAKKLLNW
ncbi:hypothetical protein QUF80_19855 [Desulfococcaceae bacterium HSG8]|nr:hypothetical protein [Desulfococcaceae bacterium HSG8]